MRYATILFAVLLSSCSQAEPSSKSATPEEATLSAVTPADPSAGVDTVLEHIDKGDGLIVDVLQAGTGRAVQMGDTVTLDYTISYVPSATAKPDAKSEKGSKDAKESKTAPKHDAKKPVRKHTDAKTDEPAGAASDDHHKESGEKTDSKDAATKDGGKDDAAKKDTAKNESGKSDADKDGDKKSDDAKTEPEKKDPEKKDAEKKDAEKKDAPKKEADSEKHEADKSDAAKSDGEKSGADKSEKPKTEGDKPDADAKTGEHDATKPAPTPADGEHHDAAKTDEKAADAKPVEPPKPVVVASTKSMLAPFTVKLSNNAKPKLMPGLLRGLEGLKVGTHARITIPALLAYGKDGDTSAGIPAETPVQIDIVVVEARE